MATLTRQLTHTTLSHNSLLPTPIRHNAKFLTNQPTDPLTSLRPAATQYNTTQPDTHLSLRRLLSHSATQPCLRLTSPFPPLLLRLFPFSSCSLRRTCIRRRTAPLPNSRTRPSQPHWWNRTNSQRHTCSRRHSWMCRHNHSDPWKTGEDDGRVEQAQSAPQPHSEPQAHPPHCNMTTMGKLKQSVHLHSIAACVSWWWWWCVSVV